MCRLDYYVDEMIKDWVNQGLLAQEPGEIRKMHCLRLPEKFGHKVSYLELTLRVETGVYTETDFDVQLEATVKKITREVLFVDQRSAIGPGEFRRALRRRRSNLQIASATSRHRVS